MEASCGQSGNWSDISPEYAARMRLQNRFKTGLDIARYTAAIMRKDMADYDRIPASTPVSWMLAWLHRPAKAHFHQEALRQHRQALSVSFGLDDCRAAVRVWTAPRPVDA
ncbi:MAG: hypothetical protein CM15mP74_04460 [Halieaceae bacterium]|nr:MAG: hypothetical protein CM15mP74_04460 [Halieaceae bacterium]